VTPARRLVAAAGRALWYLREVVGENAYEHYLEHRRRMDELDQRPAARCC
jgi:Selenoprotein, putative